MSTLERVACRLRVTGLVQGVGFRPSVHRLATALDLCGWVCNDEAGVLIHLEGSRGAIAMFRGNLPLEAPVGARIESVTSAPAELENVTGFHIRFGSSGQPAALQARVPADRAICSSCQAEIRDSTNRRYRHPFATCTVCGPRYSILEKIPYERRHTSMSGFRMCSACAAEYAAPADRRFHAEPIACPQCGPVLRFAEATASVSRIGWDALVAAAEVLRAGKIVALKGLGGYQLLAHAQHRGAVEQLRLRKHRPSKPFAVMVASIEDAEHWAQVSPRERELLLSAENPIVLVRRKRSLDPRVAPSASHLGLMLPTTPLHLLLLSLCGFPVVATSGNQSEEPIVIDEKNRNSLLGIADAFLEHDRPIVRRVDDSVLRVIDKQPMMLRLARGYAPQTLTALERWAAASDVPIPPMLAVGGQQKTSVALWTGNQAILSAHLGDKDHPETRRVFATTIADLARLYGCEPEVVIADLHPDYFTTRWARESGKLCLQVQHHQAHAVACMAEHGLLERDVLAITWDGTGFGTDGTIWGGEVLHASVHDFQRVASLEPFALPGGELAIYRPHRIALSLLSQAFGPGAVPDWLLARLGFSPEQARTLIQVIARRVNAPLTSSVGRLFDAIAALVLNVLAVAYEGEAAVRLEAAVHPNEEAAYPLLLCHDADGLLRGDWRPMVRALVADIENRVYYRRCAARFHNALANWAAAIAATSPLPDVVLGGGCFQNARLTTRVRAAIVELGKRVFVPSGVPPNDGGLAVGQLAIGMARWQRLAKQQS